MTRQMIQYHKLTSSLLVIVLILSLSILSSYAGGFNLGLASAIKTKVQELKDKKGTNDITSAAVASSGGWIRSFGTSEEDRAYGVALDTAGTIYITGTTNGNIDGNTKVGQSNIFLSKYTPTGMKLWTREFGTTGSNSGPGIVTDSSGNIYVSFNSSFSDPGMHMAKYDSNGNNLWSKNLSSTDVCSGIAIDQSGNIFMMGYASSLHNVFLKKYNGDGNIIWTALTGIMTVGWDSFAVTDPAGNIYITVSDNKDVFLMKYNTEGIKSWTQTLPPADQNVCRAIALDGSSNILLTGFTNGNLGGSGSGYNFQAKYDNNGTNLWIKQFGIADSCNGIAADSSGNIFITGGTSSTFPGYDNHYDMDLFLLKNSSDGTNLWAKQTGTPSAAYGYAVITDQAGNAYVVGVTEGNLGGNTNQGGGDALLIKFTPDGNSE